MTTIPTSPTVTGHRGYFPTGDFGQSPATTREPRLTGQLGNVEIERKFLVTGNGWRVPERGTRFIQGYLAVSPQATIRVRIGGDSAFITVKGPPEADSIARPEYEYPIPQADALEMIEDLCNGRVVEKTRYRIPCDDLVWEVDEFHGRHAGLVIAEVELPHEDYAFEKPPWVGVEVTRDHRYSNAWLAQRSGPSERNEGPE